MIESAYLRTELEKDLYGEEVGSKESIDQQIQDIFRDLILPH